VGGAGVGKSRLCAEFVERCRARGLMVYEAHCPAHGRTVPYLPLLELLRNLFGIADQDGPREARQKIAGELALLDDAFADDRALVLDFLGVGDPKAPPLRLEPAVRQRRLFAFLRTTSAPGAAIATGNAATAVVDRWDLLDAGANTDWDALRATCAPGMVFEDRRWFARLSGDRELMIAALRERAGSGARVAHRLTGTAGDRVAVLRMLWSGGPADGRFEIEHIAMMEADESGLLTAAVIFGADDPRGAQREAWARWAAIEPAAAAVTTAIGAQVDVFNAHDRFAYRAVFAEDLVVEDHRRAGMGRIDGADAYVQSLVALWELAPASRVDAGRFWPACDRHGAITDVRRTGTVPDGGEFESDYLTLYTVAHGRVTRIELFEIADLAAALARFAELRPRGEGTTAH
jgi:ketosteroid isomerase-like protein